MSRHQIVVGDARRLPLADESVHCVVTSPPYWGLRDYGVEGQIGAEPTPEAYVETMVAVAREIRRVLRQDGTLWLNLGDTYNSYPANAGRSKSISAKRYNDRQHKASGYGLSAPGLKPKDLVGIPWRVALALQADGWYLRAEIVWNKPNAMPESVTDRPSRSHEQVFLFAKRPRYFYDRYAVRERSVSKHPSGNGYKRPENLTRRNADGTPWGNDEPWRPTEHRACRSVWTITTKPFKGAHFAVFPTDLAGRCIAAGTSDRGVCPACGSPWRRIVDRVTFATRPAANCKVNGLSRAIVGNRDPRRHMSNVRTVGWEPTCECGADLAPVPAVVLDPFSGAGSTGVAAVGLGRSYVGVELNPDYAAMSDRRISRPHAPVARASRAAGGSMPLFGEE